jgi:hypothetical protein
LDNYIQPCDRSEVSVENDETSSQEPGTHTTDAEDSKASTPPPSRVTPFHESPTKEKKKRLANLAAERAKKKAEVRKIRVTHVPIISIHNVCQGSTNIILSELVRENIILGYIIANEP